MRQDRFRKNILPIIDKLFRLAFSITGNKEDAEDVVQDVLFSVLKKEDAWNEIGNLEAYCYQAARNTALDKISLMDNRNEEFPEDFDYPVQEQDAQHKIEEQEQVEALEKWLQKLPEKQRSIFLLREVEGLSYKEIASILDISEEQIKVNLFRLRRKLKEYFEIIER
jgi:RNA polymerase sigma-70 factor (ECF subfamily)